MPYANIIDSQLVDDDYHPTQGPEFQAPPPRTFEEHIAALADQRDYVEPGWQRIFDETLVKLKAVRCKKRTDVELSEIAFGQGEMVIAAHGDGADRVVHGILSRLRQASGSTCSSCGTRYGAIYRRNCFTTLCDRCYTHTHLEQTLDDILADSPEYKDTPLIELDALPRNIQAIIPKSQIKEVHLRVLGVHLKYVEPKTLQALKVRLSTLKRALVAAQGS